MGDASISSVRRKPLIPTRKVVHISMLAFAFLLPFLTWEEAAGAALLALLFNVAILPRLDVDLRKRPSDESGESAAVLKTGVVAYPISVLILVLLFGRRMEVVAAVWAIMALGDGFASIAGEAWSSFSLPWNPRKSFAGFLGFVVAGTIGSYFLALWTDPPLPLQKTLFICIATAAVGAVVESVPIALDDNISVPLVCGAFMYCLTLTHASALWSNWPYLGRRVIFALIVNAIFALLALSARAANRSGAAMGFVLGLAIYMSYGFRSFLVLLTFVAIGTVCTHLGYSKKSARGTAQKHGGRRTWHEATANLLPAAFFSVLVITTHHQFAFLAAMVAALAEAVSDTVSSEIGQWLSGRAYLITTLKPVPTGVDGGISIGGTLVGFGAAAAVVAVGFALGLCGPLLALIAFLAAISGNLFDSLLGATIERWGLVGNGTVNFTGTSFAGGLTLGIVLCLGLAL